MLEQAQLASEVDLEAEPGRITICKGRRPRAGWAAKARKIREQDEDCLLDPPTPQGSTRGNGSGGGVRSTWFALIPRQAARSSRSGIEFQNWGKFVGHV